jgi:hypothetical protein
MPWFLKHFFSTRLIPSISLVHHQTVAVAEHIVTKERQTFEENLDFDDDDEWWGHLEEDHHACALCRKVWNPRI